jgi:hypothetical protein
VKEARKSTENSKASKLSVTLKFATVVDFEEGDNNLKGSKTL